MFLFKFMQKCDPLSSRAYCILAQLTTSNVLGELTIRVLTSQPSLLLTMILLKTDIPCL